MVKPNSNNSIIAAVFTTAKYSTMHDVLDIIRNVQSLYAISPSLGILKDFERVIDELDVYVFKNW